MGQIEVQRLVLLSREVRNSSLKRLRLVPPGRENWAADGSAMSFADLAQHLIDADGWLERKLLEPELEPMVGRPGLSEVCNRDGYLDLLGRLQASGDRRAHQLGTLTATRLEERVPDTRFGGEVSLWWVIVRGNLDHEIHHRGQMSVYLRSLGIRA